MEEKEYELYLINIWSFFAIHLRNEKQTNLPVYIKISEKECVLTSRETHLDTNKPIIKQFCHLFILKWLNLHHMTPKIKIKTSLHIHKRKPFVFSMHTQLNNETNEHIPMASAVTNFKSNQNRTTATMQKIPNRKLHVITPIPTNSNQTPKIIIKISKSKSKTKPQTRHTWEEDRDISPTSFGERLLPPWIPIDLIHKNHPNFHRSCGKPT